MGRWQLQASEFRLFLLPGLGPFMFSKVLFSAQQFKELPSECPIWPRLLAFPKSLEGAEKGK